MSAEAARLLGVWDSDMTHEPTRRQYGSASLVFYEGGEMTLTFHEPDRDRAVLLTYEVHGQNLVTDQPSSPRRESTAFEFDAEGRLLLSGHGVGCRFLHRESS